MTDSVTRADFDRFFMPTYAPAPAVIVRGRGSRVWDQDGKEYIDLAGGIAVNALGHAHPELIAVLTEQANKLWHLSNAYANEPAIRLARDLVDLTFADRVFLSNSGGEANEAALKLARRYAHDHFGPEKYEIIAFHRAFHGRTFFTVSTGGQPKYSDGFGPKPGGITHLPFNDLDALEAAMSERVCAVILEPIQGEGGLVAAEPEFLRGVRKACDRHDALLIFDEVQSGVGRTGELYAYMGYGVEPDIMTSAKALGGGIPIGATLAREHVAESFVVGTHGSTFGGNPLAAAVAGKVLDVVAAPGFLAEVRRMSEHAFRGLRDLGEATGAFVDVRGKGLWIGCELRPGLTSAAVTRAAFEHGLMVLKAGPDVVRLAPALNIAQVDLDAGLERLSAALRSLVHDAGDV